MRGRACVPASCQSLSDREQPPAGDELLEDLLDNRCRLVVDRKSVQPPSVGRLGGVGMRHEVDELVSVWRSAAEEPSFHLRLGGHRGAHADLDPVSLAFAHAAEDRHDQVVGLIVRIDRPAHFRHP